MAKIAVRILSSQEKELKARSYDKKATAPYETNTCNYGAIMELLHIKIFKKPKTVFSVVYCVNLNPSTSHFIRVEECKEFLWNPGLNPQWLDKALEMQKDNLPMARDYVAYKINEALKSPNYTVSVGYDWDELVHDFDEFTSSMLKLVNFH